MLGGSTAIVRLKGEISMKTQIVAIAFGAVAIASTANAQMPTWSEDQTSAWAYVVQSWEDDVANNGKWPADYAWQREQSNQSDE